MSLLNTLPLSFPICSADKLLWFQAGCSLSVYSCLDRLLSACNIIHPAVGNDQKDKDLSAYCLVLNCSLCFHWQRTGPKKQVPEFLLHEWSHSPDEMVIKEAKKRLKEGKNIFQMLVYNWFSSEPAPAHDQKQPWKPLGPFAKKYPLTSSSSGQDTVFSL